jgi:hypothetical protein
MVASEISMVLNKDFEETKKDIQNIFKINQGMC